MNTSLTGGSASFIARYDGLRERLPGDAEIRRAAADQFRREGLPTIRDEAWKYTSLRALAETRFHEALTEAGGRAPMAPDAALARLAGLDMPRLVFIDGRYSQDLSNPPGHLGFATFAEDGYAATSATGPLVTLNTMLAEDGATLRLPDNHDGGAIALISLGGDLHGTPTAFHPRHDIRLGAGARLTLVEISLGNGTYLHNPVTTLKLGAGARLDHVRLQLESPTAFHLATIAAEIATDATYEVFTLHLGARLARAEIHARLTGPGAHAGVNGAQKLGASQHGDFTTIIAHEAPRGTSRQAVRNVLSDRARGVFQGKIEVARAAQQTDGYQMSQALLLSPDAEIDTKPQLEIFADDVKCSHGATVGALDADQLFYLRSRGVPEAEARDILVQAFLDDALSHIAHAGARALLDQALAGNLLKDAA